MEEHLTNFQFPDSRHRPQAGQPQLCAGDQHGRDGGLPDRERVRALRRWGARQGGSGLPSQRLACQVHNLTSPAHLHHRFLLRSVAAGAETLVSDLSAGEAGKLEKTFFQQIVIWICIFCQNQQEYQEMVRVAMVF